MPNNPQAVASTAKALPPKTAPRPVPRPAIPQRAPAPRYFSISGLYVRGTEVGKVCRAAWPAGTYVNQVQQSYDPPQTGKPHVFADKSEITIFFPDGSSAPWAPTYSDLFSMDWLLYVAPPVVETVTTVAGAAAPPSGTVSGASAAPALAETVAGAAAPSVMVHVTTPNTTAISAAVKPARAANAQA